MEMKFLRREIEKTVQKDRARARALIYGIEKIQVTLSIFILRNVNRKGAENS